MAMPLKQSTAATVKVGPFLDTDGAVVTGLTIAQADIRLSKNGGNIAQSNNAAGATHDELGVYDVPLDATDTGTLGRLDLYISESGALIVHHEYVVLPANVFDSGIGATDVLQVDVAQWLGTAVSTPTTAGVPEVDVIDWKGATAPAMTGDAFARLGAPAGASVSADIAAIEAQTDDIGVAGAGLSAIPWNAAWDAEVQSEVDDAIGAAVADSVPAAGSRPSVKQGILMITRFLMERSVTTTTVTVAKEDGTTESMTFTLDDATTPTAISRTT
jgi:hypothetical protein